MKAPPTAPTVKQKLDDGRCPHAGCTTAATDLALQARRVSSSGTGTLSPRS